MRYIKCNLNFWKENCQIPRLPAFYYNFTDYVAYISVSSPFNGISNYFTTFFFPHHPSLSNIRFNFLDGRFLYPEPLIPSIKNFYSFLSFPSFMTNSFVSSDDIGNSKAREWLFSLVATYIVTSQQPSEILGFFFWIF